MNDFEQAINELEKDTPISTEVNENCVEFLRNSDTCTCTFSQKKYVTKMRKLAEKYPEECQIVVDNGNYIVAHFPTKWLKISNSKRKRELTDEQKEALRERMRKAREVRFGKSDEDVADIDIEDLDEDFDDDDEE